MRLLLSCFIFVCIQSVYAAPVGDALPVADVIRQLGQPTEREKVEGKDSLYWRSESLTIHVYAEAEAVYTLLISKTGQKDVSTVTQAFEQVERLCPKRKWDEVKDKQRDGLRVFRTSDGRLECAVILMKDGELYGYHAFIGDLILRKPKEERG